jgi:uncharacterized protein
MQEKKISWGNSRRFNSLADYCRKKYGSRIQKVSVNAGFTCPNRDGTIAIGGCSFCNNEGFSPSYCHGDESIYDQIQLGINFLEKRYKYPKHYVAYFQAYSNTHSSVEVMKHRYAQALSHPGITGLAIGTRPDCVDEEKLDYLAELAKDKFISVEYGVESCYDDILERIRRGHSFKESIRAIEMTATRGIHTGIHLIFGLPGDTPERMMQQADIISGLPINSVKFHQLQIVRGTALELEFQDNPGLFSLFNLQDYIEFITSFAERLRPDICIERFSGEVPPGYNAGPSWGKLRTDQVLVMIEKEFLKRDSWQGKNFRARV